ncbi:MAG: tRNA (adenosine(37)-N6)-dimethylallyltransferase MiaA, partial [Vallitaleaceae bacterium]|nr:tRNA (adenosine(37)-N6)-dimethylallyltransferase MiaA [Vallitaleaceae bacterium]
IVIAGPTASGKTGLSIALAKEIGGEIISADSMQAYRLMDIGTAKVTEQEKEGVPHHLIDFINPDEPFNIHIFQKKAMEVIEDIHLRGKIPILVGGTGFYIQSVVYNIQFDETIKDTTDRKNLERLALEKGNTYVHQQLKEIDPLSYEKIHPNNIKRVIRALEYHKQTGRAISLHNEMESQKTTPFNLLFYVLNMDRKMLYDRIDQRVEGMLEKGLLNEVESLKARGYSQNLVAMQGIGYKELYDHLEGRCTLAEAQEIIKRNTRHFAKRQMTWFRREKEVIWLEVDPNSNNHENILSKIRKDIEVMGFM